MSQRALNSIILLGVFALILSGCFYTIQESHRGVKLKFGQVIGAELQPGLGFKIPVIHEIRKFDARVQSTYLQQEEYFTAGKKLLMVDSFIMWKIQDVKKYYTATSGNLLRAASLIEPRVNEQLRNEFGIRTIDQVITDERDQILEKVKGSVKQLVLDGLGVEVIDIRVKKIELPLDVSESVYERMRAERDKDAKKYRSEGEEKGLKIRANADLEARVIIADANRQAEITRGEGDAIAAKTYAEGYGKDMAFFEFYRSLTAYKNTFANKSDMILMQPKGEFFDYLKSSAKGQ